MIAALEKKREYIFSAPDGWRKFEFEFSELEKALIARNSPEDLKAMDAILAAYPRAEFPWRWLMHCGFPEEQVKAWRGSHQEPQSFGAEAA